jgi:hypothetical protein
MMEAETGVGAFLRSQTFTNRVLRGGKHALECGEQLSVALFSIS